jgi:glucose-1-phosphate cytidylyltransferase
MRIYAAQGFDDFILAVGYLKEHITKYFRGRRSWHVECVDTGLTTDTGGRVRHCLEQLGDTFHATYCDGLGDVDLVHLVEHHKRHGDGATVTAVPLRSQYGILKSDHDDRIVEFIEKPTLPEYWINAGFFVFDRCAFEGIEGENLENDLLPAMARRNRLHVNRHRGFWRSMDTHKDQQELDRLWSPFSNDLERKLPAETAVPAWLMRHYQVAMRGSA